MATYYVKNGGSDAATGLSDALAWETINKVNTSSFSPGDSILFKKGDTWRETLTIPSSGSSVSDLTFSSYGSGDKPRILGSETVTVWNQGTVTGRVANNDLLAESFEGVGYTDAGWEEHIGANESNLIDEDNTEVARPTGGGAQVLKIVKDITPTGTQAASAAWVENDLGGVMPITYVDFYVMVNAASLPNNLDMVYLYRGVNASYDNVNTLILRNVGGDIRFFAGRYLNSSEDGFYFPKTAGSSITLDQWYHVQIKYDVTNHSVSCTVDGTYLYAGVMGEGHRDGIQRIILGDGSYVKSLTAYYDLVNVSSTNFYSADLVLPANTWYSDNSLYDPYLMTYGGNIYFTELDGSISWGRIKKSAVGDLAVEYDWTHYPDHIIVYSTTDPGTTYTNVEVSERLYGINMNNQEYLVIDGLEVAYVGMYGIGDFWPATNITGLTIKNCLVHHIGMKEGGHALEVWHSNSFIQDNVIHDGGRRGISLNIYEGDCQLHDVVVERNVMYNGNHTTGPDISSFGATSTIDNVIVRNNFIYDDPTVNCDGVETFRSAGIFAEMEGVGSVSNIYVYNNIIVNTNYIALLFMHIPQSYIYSNTFYGVNPYATEDLDGIIEILGTTTNTVIKNNIVYNNNVAATRIHYACLFTNVTGTLDCDYNLYYNTDAATDLMRVSGTSYLSSAWVAYKAATGWDGHSPTPANPLFTSSTNYNLQAASPAIDSGISGAGIPTTDFYGNARTGVYDIGAIEYGATPWWIHQYVEYVDPATGWKYRDGVRSAYYVIDKELILDGFSTDIGGGEGENVDWENVSAIN